MSTETYPVMQVKQSIMNSKPLYELILSRENFNHLCAGCPDIDRLVGIANNSVEFYIFNDPHGEMPKFFKPLPDRQGYWANVGAPVPRLPSGVSDKEFCKLAQQAYDNLEKAINNSDPIPIQEETEYLGKLNLGSVIIRVEKE